MKKFVKICLVGNFYDAYDNDAIVLHEIMGYKYVTKKNSVGFPIVALNKVLTTLENAKIGYEVYNRNEVTHKFKGIDKNYEKVLTMAMPKLELEIRLENLKNKINKLSGDNLLEVISKLELIVGDLENEK